MNFGVLYLLSLFSILFNSITPFIDNLFIVFYNLSLKVQNKTEIASGNCRKQQYKTANLLRLFPYTKEK